MKPSPASSSVCSSSRRSAVAERSSSASARNKANSKDLDPNILILDALGLVFWIVPGLVAYGVDFYTRCDLPAHRRREGPGPFIKDEKPAKKD